MSEYKNLQYLNIMGKPVRVYANADNIFSLVPENKAVSVLASAARTTTVHSADQTNEGGRGVHIILDVTASDATPSVVLTIEGKAADGTYYTILQGAAVTGISTNVYKVAPWQAAAANVSASDFLPRTWRVTVTHADADSITYSVSANVTV